MKNKITAPKKTTIKGQPHELAYINDREQGLLMALGGAGKPVHGVLAYYDEGDGMESSGGDQSAGADGRQGSPDGGDREGGNQDFNKAVQDAANKAKANLEKSLASKGGGTYANPMANSQMTAADMFNEQAYRNFINENYDLTNQSGSYGGQRIFGGTTGEQRAAIQAAAAKGNLFAKNLLKAMSLDDLSQATTTGYLEKPETGLIGGYMSKAPDFVQGAANLFSQTSILGNLLDPSLATDPMLVEVYSGDPSLNPNREDRSDREGNPVVDPVDNPLTGEKACPDGYIFDDQLQACRLDTGSSGGGGFGDGNFGDDALTYYRPTILDTPSQFDPDPQRFTGMNNAFIDSFAYNPALYQNKMDITGFAPTPNSGLLG